MSDLRVFRDVSWNTYTQAIFFLQRDRRVIHVWVNSNLTLSVYETRMYQVDRQDVKPSNKMEFLLLTGKDPEEVWNGW